VRDYQRRRVYDWEGKFIAPLCSHVVLFANAQQYVDGVWLANGWTRAPQVRPLPKQAKRKVASGTYGYIHLPDKVKGWIILHELAHSVTDDLHGPNFVGMYIDLLERMEDLSKLMTLFTLKQAKIDFNLGVKPLDWVVRRT
jgi:hypothetical protein